MRSRMCAKGVSEILVKVDGLRLVSLSEVQGASKSAFKLTSPHTVKRQKARTSVEKNVYLLELWTRTEEFCHADADLWPALGGRSFYPFK